MTTAAETHGAIASFRSVWRHRRWRWLLGSVLVSLAGDFLYWVALVVHLSRTDDGASWIAAALLARFIPYVVLGPFGGAFADRFDRRRTLVILDLTRAALFVAMAGVVAADGPRVAIIALLAAVAIAGTFYRPALVAATPVIVPENDIAAANAAEEGLAQLAWFVGPALGAILVSVFDPGVVLVVDAATFAVSAAMVARVGNVGGGRPAPGTDRPPVTDGGVTDGEETAGSGMLGDVRDGIRTLVRDRGLISLTALTVGVLFAFGAEQVLYVFVATDRLDLGPEGVGYLMAAMGVGGLVAAPLSVRVGNSPRLGWWLAASSAASCTPLVLISFVTSEPLGLLLAAIEGAGAIVFEVGAITLLQRAVTESMLGRVYAVQDSIGALGQTIGSIAAPALVVAFGLNAALRTTGVAAIAIVAVSAPGLVALARTVDVRRRAVAAAAEWLAATDELGAFPASDHERLARAATELTVSPGTAVVTEGEPADDLYVVRSGTLAVTIAGATEQPPDLGPGDVFGEIGLLRGGVRTATVTAADDVELYRITGAVFVDVATPSAAAASPLLGGMRMRLHRTHPHLIDPEPSTEAS